MPLDTILLLDTSGSMAGRGMRELQRACHVFLDGVEETARQTGLKENVAVVEFNTNSRVVQSLTNDYGRVRRAVDSLRAGGSTGMLDGIMDALKEILQNGGVVRICGCALTPRVILMTDGEPSDPAGEIEAKKKVLASAIAFGPGWRQIGLPHPVPIACVGCGACDVELLQAIAKLTNGMYVIVSNIAELSTFFKRQVLLIRFAMKFAADMNRLRSRLALAAFLAELGEAVEQAELEAMMTLLLAMVVRDEREGDSSPPTARVARLAISDGSSASSAAPQPRPSPQPRPPPPSQQRVQVVAPPPPRPSSGGAVIVQRRVVITSAAPGPPRPSSSRNPPPPPPGRDPSCSIQ